MDNHVLRLRSGGLQGQGVGRPRLRPLAVYKPSFSLKHDAEEGQALLGTRTLRTASARCSQPPPVPARRRREVAPSSGCPAKLEDTWDGDRDGADGVGTNCCCGTVALPGLPTLPSALGFPWARTSHQHQPDKHIGKPGKPGKAMNTRGIFSHTLAGDPPVADTLLPLQQQQPQQSPQTPGAGGQGGLDTVDAVYRGPPPGPSPPWSSRVPDGAGAAPTAGGVVRPARRSSSTDDHSDDTAQDDAEDDDDGVKKMLEAPCRKELPPLPPLPSTPLRRRVLVRTKQDIPTYFRLNAAADTAALLPPVSTPRPSPVVGPMDRFNKLRFGGRVDDIKKGNARTARTSDKTERLRELTERLKAGPDRAATPSPSPSPTPTAVSAAPAPAPAAATAPESAEQAESAEHAEHADSPVKEDDLFELRLARPESRAIVGSYIQRTIPFRSASFSQVDFTDGKYLRHSPRSTWLVASATLPRKKASPDDLSPVTSSSSIAAVEPSEGSVEPSGSTPSVDSAVESAVDSAVGSDEGCFEPRSPMGPVAQPRVAAKPPGSRSMTHPLPSRGPRVDDGESFSSSVDGNGLRNIQGSSQDGDVTPESLLTDSTSDSGALLGVVMDPGFSNSGSSLEHSDALVSSPEAPAGSGGDLSPPPPSDIKALDNPVSYEVFVRQFPNYKEYEKWMNESVLVNNSDQPTDIQEWQARNEYGVIANGGSNDSNNNNNNSLGEARSGEMKPPAQPDQPVEHDDRCINFFDPSTCPKCLEQMETGPSILQKLKASFHMEDLELEPHEKELYSRHTDILLRKWTPVKAKHPFERSKSEPKDDKGVIDPLAFQRTKSTDEAERETVLEPPQISLPSSDEKDTPESGTPPSLAVQSRADEELKRRRPKDEPRRWLERPKLICQSSDERDDESSAGSATPRQRFPVRSDSLSEGESDQGDRRPSTPNRTSPSLYSHLDLSDSESRAGTLPQTAASQRSERCTHTPRRYSKRPLRGPYGQMLEAEMKKPEANRKLSQYTDDLKFLEEYPSKASGSSLSLVVCPSSSLPTTSAELTRSVSSGEQRQAAAPRNRHQGAGAHSMDDSQLRAVVPSQASLGPASAVGKASAPKRKVSATELPFASLNPQGGPLPVCHQRTTSSPSQLEGIANRVDMDLFRRQAPPVARNTTPSRDKEELTADPTKGNWKDTRTHVVVELYETERSYVESLDFLVKEYMQPLKKPENAGMVDSELVEQIFYQVPAIHSHHREFLDDLQKRLENWDFQQKVGDVLLNAFTKRSVIETYTAFINNWKTAKEAIKSTCQAKPAFARYLEAMAREHKGKLALDSLLIMPVQRIPRYELLIQTLLKHTDPSHADHSLLLDAQREVHELAVKINCTERESLEAEQQQQTLRDLEALVEGCDLVAQGRVFLRHDLVTLASGQSTRKERVLFLFSDLVVIARIKRNLRKPSAAGSSTSVASGLEGNRYRCSMKAALDDLEIVKAKDESLRRVMREMEQLSEDVAALTQITELAAGLHLQQQQQLEELARDLLSSACRQLAERQNSDSQLSCLDLTVNTTNGVENITVIFTKPDKRASWEESFNEAKTRLALSADRRPSPKFKTSVPIRKTRAGLQFTCAAPTLAGPGVSSQAQGQGQVGDRPGRDASRDVWVCNSDGYVGQVCVLSLLPEPNVTSCNGVCNARILCVAAIPAGSSNAAHNVSQGQFTNSKAGISISVEDTDKTGRNLHLDSSSSSSDEEDDNDSTTEERQRLRSNTAESQASAPTAPGVSTNGNADSAASAASAASATQGPSPSLSSQASPAPGSTASSSSSTPSTGASDDSLAQPTMWLGTEDGCIHVYSCNDNIRIKRNKIKIQHGAAVHCIMYFDNRVFVSLANGDVTVYSRDQAGGWNTTEPFTVTVGSAACPVTRMVPISGRLWCSCQHTIKILNTNTLQVEQTVVAADSNRAVTCFVVSGLAVWLSVQNSAILKLYHASTFEHLGDVNVAPAVTKMLASCDDIIRQHKAACLRVTSLLACKDLLWIGTSAGVILTMPLPHVAPGTTRLTSTPNVLGVPHGHTGHVRFLTVVEAFPDGRDSCAVQSQTQHNRHSWKGKSDQASSGNTNKLLVISGGDGYEDFRTSSVSEVAGKEDSTNHLLMWQV